jgi:hypothetical protein
MFWSRGWWSIKDKAVGFWQKHKAKASGIVLDDNMGNKFSLSDQDAGMAVLLA